MIEGAFKPWVGAKYGTPHNRFNRRILVLGESHYGPAGTEHPDTTIEVVTYFTQGGARHSFFTKIAKVLLGLDEKSGWLEPELLADVFDNVAFYNYVPRFAGDYARQRPSSELWEAGQAPFHSVLENLRPDLVIVLGKALDHYVPELPSGIRRCPIQHPSTGFSYTEWGPKVAAALEGPGVTQAWTNA